MTRTQKRYSGVVVPMMTPFTANGKVDTPSIARLTNHVVAHGTHPFVLGTTGEAVSIARSQRMKVVEATVFAVQGRATVYAGISGNALEDVVAEANCYATLGVDVVVSTMPSYYPVDEIQIIRYFTQLADSLHVPLIVYNIPATTHLSIPVSVADQLSQHPNIIGFKDSERGVERIAEATTLWKDRADFSYFMGWALMSRQALAQGADGIIPSSGNVAPAVYRKI